MVPRRLLEHTRRHATIADTTLLEGTDLSASYDGMRKLFTIPKLLLKRGQKLGVVGANGCGKSTLLKAIAARTGMLDGMLSVTKGVRVAIVEQSLKLDPFLTVQAAIFERAASPKALATRAYLAAMKSGDVDALTEACDVMESADAWTWEANALEVMNELGLDDTLQSRTVDSLSGGEERRVALACALVDLDSIDLLILDEPTNHLSAEGSEWLQELIQSQTELGVILVTHDRYFLDEVTDQILEIDGLGAAFMHPGGWSTFLTRRAERFEKQQALVSDAKVQLKAAEEWMLRGPRGRQTKNQAQMNAYEVTKGAAEAVIATDQGAPDLASSKLNAGKSTARAITIGLSHAVVTRPDRGIVLNDISFEFTPGMKIGIVGPNGAGKSTFLQALMGEIPLESGKRILGSDARIGHLSQQQFVWPDPTQRVLNVVSMMADNFVGAEGSVFGDTGGKERSREQIASMLLKTINFPPSRWQTQLLSLSGGEQRRLQLLYVLSGLPNVLILDEPTNDLDAVTVDALERLIKPWDGTVIVVSHDRSLLDSTCQQLLVFSEDGTQPDLWKGTHSDLRAYQKQQILAAGGGAGRVGGEVKDAPDKGREKEPNAEDRVSRAQKDRGAPKEAASTSKAKEKPKKEQKKKR